MSPRPNVSPRPIVQGALWSTSLDLRKGKAFNEITKKHWVDFYHYRVVVYTHCQHTFQFKQLVKVHVALHDPFNINLQTINL